MTRLYAVAVCVSNRYLMCGKVKEANNDIGRRLMWIEGR